MRKSELRNGVFYLNNKPYYQRLVLDQGYYPDGQWTAPTDEQLKRDIELGKAAGFNGAIRMYLNLAIFIGRINLDT